MVVAQRLLRRLDSEKSEKYEPEEEGKQMLKDALGPLFPTEPTQLTLRKPIENVEDAFSGRVGIYEVLPLSEKIARMVSENATADAIESQAIEEGMIKMIQDGFLKAIKGITTVEEVLRVAKE